MGLNHSGNRATTWSRALKFNTDSTTTSQFFPRIAVDQTNGKLAVWLFLVTEIMFFTALIGTYVLLRSGMPAQVREVKDPATGKVIRRVEDSVGSMTVTEVDADSAVGKYSGGGQPKVGDSVSTPK